MSHLTMRDATSACTAAARTVTREQVSRAVAELKRLGARPVVDADGVRCYALQYGTTMTNNKKVIAIDTTHKRPGRGEA